MNIYLPIAQIPADVLSLLTLGIVAGISAGLFGLGGGFIITPVLIFMGVPPAIAVSSAANQIVAASFSGCIAHWRRKNVDVKMGMLLLFGGMFGSGLGAWLFAKLQKLGYVSVAITITYVIVLGSIGTYMLIESINSLIKPKDKEAGFTNKKLKYITDNLPYKLHFSYLNQEISAILPILVGFFASILVAIIGIGGGFVMVPAMIYLLRMPTQLAIGTSLFQIIFISANVTLLHALNTHSVDIILTLIMLIGSVTGAQIGTRLSARVPAEYLRIALASLILILVTKLALEMFLSPANLYEVELAI